MPRHDQDGSSSVVVDRRALNHAATLYAIFSSLWIVGSDALLYLRGGATENGILVSIGKGLLFVAVTTALLYVYVRWTQRRTISERDALQMRLFTRAQIGFVRGYTDGSITAANDALAQMLGYETVDELRAVEGGMNAHWMDPSDRQRLLRLLEQHGSLQGDVLHLRRRDGTEVWVSANLHLVTGVNGESPIIEGFVQDITRHRDSEQALLEAERDFRQMFESAQEGILWADPTGAPIKVNPAFARMLGYDSPAEFVETVKNIRDEVCMDHVASDAMLGELMTTGASRGNMLRWRRRDGSTIWVSVRLNVVAGKGGEPARVEGFVQDVTEGVKADERMRESELRYRTAFQMGLDAMAINRQSDGVYIDCNQALLASTGYTREEVIGRSSLEIEIWADPADRERLHDSVQQTGICNGFEMQFRKKNGETVWGLISASLIELNGEMCLLSVTRDLSQVKHAEQEIRSLAFFDPLTGLPNRRMLLDRLRALGATRGNSNRLQALLFVDLDNFKTLNDTLGHNSGDVLLREIGSRLTGVVRDGDLVARLGGDEFVVLLNELSSKPGEAVAQAELLAERILQSVRQPLQLADREIASTCSIGVAVFDGRGEDAGKALQQADIAMYQAKAAGRNTVQVFAPSLQEAVHARAELESSLRRGIANNEFELWYQPQIVNDSIASAEALLRWNHPTRGLLKPASFIGLAEESGLVIQLGEWVLKRACVQIASCERDDKLKTIGVSVNVSVRQFRQPEFIDQVLSALKSSGANPKLLTLELTESMLLEDAGELIARLSELKKIGVQLALDDFGTGYSSLAYLKRLPLDQIKIDRSFIHNITHEPVNQAVVGAILALGVALHLQIVSEGIETEEELNFLCKQGCLGFQGFLFSHPLPVPEFELQEWLPVVADCLDKANGQRQRVPTPIQ